MAISNFRVAAPGLADLRRDLNKIDKELGRAATQHIREVAAQVRIVARSRAPRRTGALQRSIRYSVRQRGASIYSNLVYAPIHEYGGAIRPKGTPITIEGKRFMQSAAEDRMATVAEEMGDLLDGIARRYEFH